LPAEFLPSLRALLKNTKYITCLLVGVCDTYIVAGVFIVLPRYLEVHFHLAAYRANALAGERVLSSVKKYISYMKMSYIVNGIL